ncbi:MAG: hypothetical protein HYS07_10665 [Chlamydiae bacterium]|nr:hypothetical protein [Chlamydiota bacterium]MBI3276894.1 hypothetical protein [Chlamydiota bacterium]
MVGKHRHLIGLLNLNGNLSRTNQFKEPYHFHRLLNQDKRKLTEDFLGRGEILIERIKKMKMLNAALKTLGMSPYLEKFFKKNSGKIF